MNIEHEKLVGRVDARMSQNGTDAFLSALIECSMAQNLIDKANEVLKQRKEAVSETLFTLAKDSCDNNVHTFLDRCSLAETEFKEAKTGRVIPKQWSQAKSNIKAALERDMDLGAFATESAMRKELTKKRKAEREAKGDKPESIVPGVELADCNIQGELVAKALSEFTLNDTSTDTDKLRHEIAYDMVRKMLDKLEVLKTAPVEPAIEGEVVRVAH